MTPAQTLRTLKHAGLKPEQLLFNQPMNPWLAMDMSGLSLDSISLFQFANRDEESALVGIGLGLGLESKNQSKYTGPFFTGIEVIA